MNLGLKDESSMSRVRKAQEAGGFDPAPWQGLAGLGTFSPPQSRN
ncbi:MAG: hypothetical protein ABIS10_01740 [Novosphingobium sp.]